MTLLFLLLPHLQAVRRSLSKICSFLYGEYEQGVLQFAEEHQKAEQEHLMAMDQVLQQDQLHGLGQGQERKQKLKQNKESKQGQGQGQM